MSKDKEHPLEALVNIAHSTLWSLGRRSTVCHLGATPTVVYCIAQGCLLEYTGHWCAVAFGAVCMFVSKITKYKENTWS